MRKAISLLVIFSIIYYSANAGWGSNTRKKCNWWAKKYTAHAHIHRAFCGYHYSNNGSCDFAYVNFTKSYCCNVNAEVYADNSSSGQHGWFRPACKMSGYELSALDIALFTDEQEMETPDYQQGLNEASIVPSISKNQVNLKNIYVLLKSDVNDPWSNTFTVAVWLPQDDTINGIADTIYNVNKALVFGTVTLISGQMFVSGNIFTQNDFNLIQQNGIVTITYIGENKTINLPVSINSDYVAVTSFGDISPNNIDKYRKAAETNNGVVAGNLDFNIYPNPSNDVINLQYSFSEKKILEISIYDEFGRLIRKKEEIIANDKGATNTINISEIPSGAYFILAEGNDFKIIKYFIIK